MKTLATALIAAGVLAAAPAALACDRAPYDERHVHIDAAGLPGEMVRAAARIDVAVAERVEPLDVEAWLTQAWATELANADAAERARIEKVKRGELASYGRPTFGRVRYRIVETLKGPPAEDMSLIAFLYAEGSPEALHRRQFERTDQRGDYSDPKQVYMTDSLVQADQGNGWDCNTSLHVVQGRRYLIFRDAAGNLLGEMRVPGQRYGGNRRRWPVHEQLLADDPWLARVRKAAQ
jgi:hypothetical protein